MDPAPVRGLPEPTLQPFDRGVEGTIEIWRAGLRSHDRPARSARDLDMLALLGLPWILLVMEFDVDSDDPTVISLDPGKLVSYVLAVVIGNLDISAPHDNVHVASRCSRRQRDQA